MIRLSHQQLSVHHHAVQCANRYRRDEVKLIEAITQVSRAKVDRYLGETSLMGYCVKYLKLTEAVSYAFMTVTKKSQEIPELLESIRFDRMTVNKASRMCRALTKENARELIAFAEKASVRELDAKLAELNPQKGKRTSKRDTNHDTSRFSLDMKKTAMKKFERAKILMTKTKKLTDGDILEAALDLWLKKNDPVRKAERAKNKAPTETQPTGKRERIPQATLHAVNLRDRGQCCYETLDGTRCNNTKYVHVHHVKPVSHGGTNDVLNLITLCATHHDLVHQLSLPLEEQMNWLAPNPRTYEDRRESGKL